jgi:GNAT superfamily N-acetyltransferase
VTAPEFKILRVAVDVILPLRHKILRAGMPFDSARFDGDLAESTLHLAAMKGSSSDQKGEVFGCLSWMLNSFYNQPAWQLRGMAVDEGVQRHGVGGTLLRAAEEALARAGKTDLMWCNARTPAAGFYSKNGWTVVSDVFEIPTAGPHVRMVKKLNRPNQRETVEKRGRAR